MSLPATQTLVPFRKSGRRHGFPVVAPLVGRSDDVAATVVGLTPGALVTLLGPPGIGKTSLAVWVADRLADDISAWFCDLGEARTEAELSQAVLAALGEDAGEVGRVGEAVSERGRALIVLDNFESLVPFAPRLRDWMARAPEAAWLVTSRERLAIDGERVMELGPLSLPGRGGHSDAVDLFLRRARDAGGQGLDQTEAIAEVVRTLDGIPLAIELAAARTRLMSPRALVDRIHRDLLELGKRGSARHRTLASAIAWSWELLDDDERRTLMACSVFAAGFRVDDVEAVLGQVGIADALTLVGALRDKSLIHPVAVDRFGLYASIRAFAAERLGEQDPRWVGELRTAHAAHYADLAARVARTRLLVSSGADAKLPPDVRRDTGQFGVALDRVRSGGTGGEEEARMAGALAAALALVGGRSPEEVERVLATSTGPVAALARYRALRGLGRLDDGYALLETVAAREDVEPGLRAMARVLAGVHLRAEGDSVGAEAHHRQADRDIDATTMPILHGVNLACRGRLACDAGDVERARALNAEAIEHQERFGESWLAALSLANLAQLEQEHGRFERAESLLERAIERFRAAGEPEYETIYAAVCAGLYLEWGKLELAHLWFEAAQGPLDGLSPAVARILVAGGRAVLAALEGDRDAAGDHLERARRDAVRSASTLTRVLIERYAAAVAIALGRMSDVDRAAWAARLDAPAADTSADARVARGNIDVRFAGRLVALALHRTSSEKVLEVARGALSFAIGDDEVDLSRRGAPRRILEVLVKEHGGRGRALGVAALAEAGWPGERILVEARATRVRVAIATLRKLGLRDVLLTRDDGYLIDPDVAIRVS